MNNFRSFTIKRKEGLNFSKISGDKNKIHTDNLTGYNSIFGNIICHGVLVIFKFFKIISIKKKIEKKEKFSIDVEFKKHVIYDEPITLKFYYKRYKIVFYHLLQKKEVVAIIKIADDYSESIAKIKKITKSKKITPDKKFINYYKKLKIDPTLGLILSSLSRYVGTIYPGENSIIKKININFNSCKKNNEKSISFTSKLIDKRFPIIENRLKYRNYLINFETIIRPKLYIHLKKPTNKILKLIKSINCNILIIGASSGIGFDLLNLFKYNKKIKIISTYCKNKIKIKGKNIIKKQVDVEKNFYLIKNIIKKYNPIIIYYFATPKININSKNLKILNLYKKYYLYYPTKILNFSKNYYIKFFYPSTTYVNTKKNLDYSKIKLQAEKKITKFKNEYLRVNILRIPEINTKQNLSLVLKKLPNFRDILFKYKKIQASVFFK
jgi:hypothetical protein